MNLFRERSFLSGIRVPVFHPNNPTMRYPLFNLAFLTASACADVSAAKVETRQSPSDTSFRDSPKRDADPASWGWKPVAAVDTRGTGVGGPHAASVSETRGSALGVVRLFPSDIESPNAGEARPNTMFGEVDFAETSGAVTVAVAEKIVKTYPSPDGKFKFAVDATLAPDLVKWVESDLMPVVQAWYPKLIAMLPSERYTAPNQVALEFRTDMGGTPAYASGNKLSLSAPWFRDQLQREAKGCVIHELVHIVQSYGRAAATNPKPSATPGWVTEGIPDYIRWFLYEPQAKGAEITPGNFARSNYDSSYRTTANFLNWVVETHDKEFIRKLNAAAREGNYSEKVWKDSTGKTAEQLGQEWKAANAKRLGL